MNRIQNFKPTQAPVIIENEAELDLPEYINKPEYVTNKSVDYALKAAGWFLFMMLFMPFITLLLWSYGIHNIYHYVLDGQNKIYRFNIISLGIPILILVSLLLIWANYNWFRFRKTERRYRCEDTSLTQFAENFNCTEQDILSLRQSKNVTLYYDDQGMLQKFEKS